MTTEQDLPLELNEFQAVEAAYPKELARGYDALQRGLAVLIECDKELTPYFFRCLRDRLKSAGRRCIYLDGRPSGDNPAINTGMMGTMIRQLQDVVRGAVDESLVVLPHLDLLTTTSGGLTAEAREVIPLMYENPHVLWLAFKDHSFAVPKVIEQLFPHRECIIGIPRDRLPYLITQRESRKFGKQLNLYHLYKYVSGTNAVRLRKLLSSLVGEDYPQDAQPAYQQLRHATLVGELTVPEIDLQSEIGGYTQVKKRLQREILGLLQQKDKTADHTMIESIESLVPRGMIFCGPPGTGKTLFAKAMASALGAAVIVVSGPELKSRWVGESEERIRQIFIQARNSAPSIIIFDELDSFAVARGTYTGSGVEHSMVNQLLTEMDGFRDNEMVFVAGTTNFAESLDPALLRPGRFEFILQVPYPNADDRLAIFKIYNDKLRLHMDQRTLDYAVKRTAEYVEGGDGLYTGDHINALCRAIARRRIRKNIVEPAQVADVERALSEYINRPQYTSAEENVIATHECGHAVCALHCDHAPNIDRISIAGDLAGALGFVQYGDPAHRYVITRGALLDSICVLFGGREAESLLLDDVSIGAMQDLEKATSMARALVEQFGLGPGEIGMRSFMRDNADAPELSNLTREKLEHAVAALLEEQRLRARDIIDQHREELKALRELLLEKKIIDRRMLGTVVPMTED